MAALLKIISTLYLSVEHSLHSCSLAKRNPRGRMKSPSTRIAMAIKYKRNIDKNQNYTYVFEAPREEDRVKFWYR